MTYRAAVSLGSNLGDRLATMQTALASLHRIGTVERISPLYETAPVGGPPQDPYLNAVVVLVTNLNPVQLLHEMLEIEARAGREREQRWGPRTLDLDLIVVTGEDGSPVTAQGPSLILPHPRADRRRFVLEPLAEVWPQAPLGSETAGTALESVSDQAVVEVADDWEEAAPSWASPALLAAQLGLFAVFAAVTWVTRGDVGVVLVVVGAVIVLVGLSLGAWAVSSLGPAFTPFPEPLPGATLVEDGPYRRMRHPIYSAVLLTMFGLAVALASPGGLAVAGLTTMFFWFKAGYEERRLRLVVPGYSSYAARVRGRLLPR